MRKKRVEDGFPFESPHTKDASPPPLLSSCSLLSIPSVVVTISTSANPQQSGGMHLLVARSVLLLPVVQADCAEQRPSRRRRTKSDRVDNKTCSKTFDWLKSFRSPHHIQNNEPHFSEVVRWAGFPCVKLSSCRILKVKLWYYNLKLNLTVLTLLNKLSTCTNFGEFKKKRNIVGGGSSWVVIIRSRCFSCHTSKALTQFKKILNRCFLTLLRLISF